MIMGTLYIIPTPVGNMEDITMRALRILKEADLVLAEDTRTSGNLLRHYEISNHLMAGCPATAFASRASCHRRRGGRQDWRA